MTGSPKGVYRDNNSGYVVSFPAEWAKKQVLLSQRRK